MPRHEDTGSENQEGAATCEALRDEGNHFLHVQQYNKAIESFTKVIGSGWGKIHVGSLVE